MTYNAKELDTIVHQTLKSPIGLIDNIGECAEAAPNLAAELTRIPLAVITHSILNRHKQSGQQAMTVYETTMELLQYVSVVMLSGTPYHKIFVGDCHTCALFCEKCKRQFGVEGDIFQVLPEAPHAILHHHGLELPPATNINK
mgnify:CR=1 FL=1